MEQLKENRNSVRDVLWKFTGVAFGEKHSSSTQTRVQLKNSITKMTERKLSTPLDPTYNPVSKRRPTVHFADEDSHSKRFRSVTARIKKPSFLWNILFITCVALCFIEAFYQVARLLDIYFRYPFTVSVSVESKPNLTLPGITFCSSIGVRKSGVEAMPGFSYAMQEMLNKIVQENNTKVTDPEKQKLLDYFYFSYLEKTPIDTLIVNGLNFSEFVVVKETKCALDEAAEVKSFKTDKTIKSKRIRCKNEIDDDFIESFQGSFICWTLFHASKGNKLTSINVPSGYTQSPVFLRDIQENNKQVDEETFEANDDMKEDEALQPLEIIRFIINFTQNESVKLDKPSVGSVSVHDPDEIRLARLEAIPLQPGKFYEIFIEEEEAHLLPAPYNTDCYAYLKYNQESHLSHRSLLPPHPFFSKPLSSSDCTYGCLGKESVKRCGCWPPEIPYVSSKSYHSETRTVSNITFCDWIKRASKWKEKKLSEKTRAMVEFYECFSSDDVVEMCMKKCRKECIKSRFKTTTQSRVWPSNERIRYAKVKESQSLKEYRNCCSVVSIRMATNEITIYSYAAKYDFVEFISYIGGIVSLWLGFTFIGIFDYFKSVVMFIWNKRNQNETKRSNRFRRGSVPDEPSLPPVESSPIPWYIKVDSRRNSKVVPTSPASDNEDEVNIKSLRIEQNDFRDNIERRRSQWNVINA